MNQFRPQVLVRISMIILIKKSSCFLREKFFSIQKSFQVVMYTDTPTNKIIKNISINSRLIFQGRTNVKIMCCCKRM